MSRLHKKKPAGEKKKRREKPEVDAEASASVSKSAPITNPLKAKSDKSADAADGEPGFIQRATEFFREVKVELKKVTWPSRKQTTGTTVVVIIFVFVVAAFLGLFDLGLSKLVQVVLT